MVKQIASLAELEAAFKEAGSKAVLIDFFATWCGPCRAIAPKLQELSEQYKNVVVLKCDVDEAADVAEKYKIEAMPTFKLFVNGKEVASVQGANAQKLEELFKAHS